MSWGAPEYLHLVLSANAGGSIPPPTLWLLRHAKFCTLTHGGYSQLLDDFDRSMLPWLREFQVRCLFGRSPARRGTSHCSRPHE